MMEATTSPNEASTSSSTKKRGVLRRLFRKSSPKSDKRSPSPQCIQDVALPRDSPPPEMHPASSKKLTKPQNNPRRAKPPASEAAFRGPPRYNWQDIETAAAIKVQAAYRRNHAMNRLEEEGVSTSAIRNRARRRQYTLARDTHGELSLFACCAGPEFSWTGFGDPYEAQREYEKTAYEKKKKARMEREEELRTTFGQRLRRKKDENKVDEAYEVVE